MKKHIILLIVIISIVPNLLGQHAAQKQMKKLKNNNNYYSSCIIPNTLSHHTYKPVIDVKSNLTVYGLMLGSILLDASGDAMMDSGNKELGHLLNAGSIACLLTIPIVKKIELKQAPWYLAGYIGLRFTFFDITYGSVHPDVNYLHQGTRSYYDQFINRWSAESLLFVRGLTFVASFDIIMKRI